MPYGSVVGRAFVMGTGPEKEKRHSIPLTLRNATAHVGRAENKKSGAMKKTKRQKKTTTRKRSN